MDEFSQELLSGYLDGELTPAEESLVEQALVEVDGTRELLDELAGVGERVRALPTFAAGENFADQVLAELPNRNKLPTAGSVSTRHATESPRADHTPSQLRGSTTTQDGNSLLVTAVAFAALAASLLGVLLLPWLNSDSPQGVARRNVPALVAAGEPPATVSEKESRLQPKSEGLNPFADEAPEQVLVVSGRGEVTDRQGVLDDLASSTESRRAEVDGQSARLAGATPRPVADIPKAAPSKMASGLNPSKSSQSGAANPRQRLQEEESLASRAKEPLARALGVTQFFGYGGWKGEAQGPESQTDVLFVRMTLDTDRLAQNSIGTALRRNGIPWTAADATSAQQLSQAALKQSKFKLEAANKNLAGDNTLKSIASADRGGHPADYQEMVWIEAPPKQVVQFIRELEANNGAWRIAEVGPAPAQLAAAFPQTEAERTRILKEAEHEPGAPESPEDDGDGGKARQRERYVAPVEDQMQQLAQSIAVRKILNHPRQNAKRPAFESPESDTKDVANRSVAGLEALSSGRASQSDSSPQPDGEVARVAANGPKPEDSAARKGGRDANRGGDANRSGDRRGKDQKSDPAGGEQSLVEAGAAPGAALVPNAKPQELPAYAGGFAGGGIAGGGSGGGGIGGRVADSDKDRPIRVVVVFELGTRSSLEASRRSGIIRGTADGKIPSQPARTQATGSPPVPSANEAPLPQDK